MTKQEFDMKYRGEKVAVHCDTEEKAKALFKLLIEFGVDKWPSGENLTPDDTRWEYNKEDTVYYIRPNFKLMWGGINGYAKEDNYTIIPFELEETFQVGDVVFDDYVVYSSVSASKRNDYKIVEFELDEPKETFKIGDVVYTKTGFKGKIVDTAWIIEYAHESGTFFKRNNELTHTKPLKKITKKELADMGYVLAK